jgi:hypothetical protein
MTSGQVAGLIDEVPTVEELVGRIVAEAAAVLDRLAAPGAGVQPRAQPVTVAPEPG